MKKESNTADATPSSFEAAIHELSDIASRLEAGGLTNYQTISAYKRAAALRKICDTTLSAVEARTAALSGEVKDTKKQ
jgi:exodeoxyribonuclease VII small subunit